MQFLVNSDSLEIISGDPTEAFYLKDLFEGKVEIIRNYDLIRNGFHTTNEQEVRITIKKGR